MIPLWLLPALAACVSAAVPDPNFTQACRLLEVDPNTGVLSGMCSPQEHVLVRTSVNLDDCLGWFPDLDPPRYAVTGFLPVDMGHFTENCHSCSIIQPGESTTQAGHILCSCAPEDSDIGLESTYDLSKLIPIRTSAKLVNVSSEGCLQCLNARQNCPTGRPTLDDEGHGRQLSIESAFDFGNFRHLLDSYNNETCEEILEEYAESNPNLLPPTFHNTGVRACANDPGLCCFRTTVGGDPGEGLETEAFKVVLDREYFYRIHFQNEPRHFNSSYNHMSMVFRICQTSNINGVRQCEEEDTPSGYDLSDSNSTLTPPIPTMPKVSGARRTVPISTTSRVVHGLADLLSHLSNRRAEDSHEDPSKVITVTFPGGTPMAVTMTLPYFSESATTVATTAGTGEDSVTSMLAAQVERELPILTETGRGATTNSAETMSPDSSSPASPPNSTEPDPPVSFDTEKVNKQRLGEIIASRLDIETNEAVTIGMRMITACWKNQHRRVNHGKDTECDDTYIPTFGFSVPEDSEVHFKGPLVEESIHDIFEDSVTFTSDEMFAIDLDLKASCQNLESGDPQCDQDGISIEAHFSQPGPPTDLGAARAFEHLPDSSNSTLIIDLSKLDVGALINLILNVTNIDEVHSATLDLRVIARCSSEDGVLGCPEMVFDMGGRPITMSTDKMTNYKATKTETKMKTIMEMGTEHLAPSTVTSALPTTAFLTILTSQPSSENPPPSTLVTQPTTALPLVATD